MSSPMASAGISKLIFPLSFVIGFMANILVCLVLKETVLRVFIPPYRFCRDTAREFGLLISSEERAQRAPRDRAFVMLRTELGIIPPPARERGHPRGYRLFSRTGKCRTIAAWTVGARFGFFGPIGGSLEVGCENLGSKKKRRHTWYAAVFP